jgi:hypothetical protein
MSPETLYALTRAMLAQANIRMYDGWRVCDPTSSGPILAAVRDHAKFYRVGDIDMCNFWSRDKPLLTILSTDFGIVRAYRSNELDTILDAIKRTNVHGEVCTLVPAPWVWPNVAHLPQQPDIFYARKLASAWLVFGPGRGDRRGVLEVMS